MDCFKSNWMNTNLLILTCRAESNICRHRWRKRVILVDRFVLYLVSVLLLFIFVWDKMNEKTACCFYKKSFFFVSSVYFLYYQISIDKYIEHDYIRRRFKKLLIYTYVNNKQLMNKHESDKCVLPWNNFFYNRNRQNVCSCAKKEREKKMR